MKLASHNSLTYLIPSKWYLLPFFWVARCQSIKLNQQYWYGIRYFDFRIRFKDSKPIICHGLMEYKGDITEYLEYLNSRYEGSVVRLILETSKESITNELLFKKFCTNAVEKYKKLTFTGFRRKFDWKKLVDCVEINSADDYSSWSTKLGKPNKWYYQICPWIYAKLFNRRIKQEGTDREYLLMDFVHTP